MSSTIDPRKQNTEHFQVLHAGRYGWTVKPKDPLDNSRWSFETEKIAQDWAEYLERVHFGGKRV